LGEAEGQNWWCVLFPNLCLGAASSRDAEDAFIAAGLTPEQYRVVTRTEEPRYRLRFKILEAFGG
jgi:stage II sporulation protein R